MDKEFVKQLDGKYVLITGSTGLIGKAVINTLITYNREYNCCIQIVATARNLDKLRSCYPEKYPYLHLIRYDVNEPTKIDYPVDYIIHTASITSSADFVGKPVEVINTTINGTFNVLKLALEKKVKCFEYLSSLEVYGIPPKFEVAESDYGYIDFTKVRSSYSEGKRMAECLCFAYASEYDVPVKVLRLTQTIGRGISYNDNRVFAQFARSVIEQKDIVLNTAGKTVRSYLGINDAVNAILTVLSRGEVGEAYNASNMKTAISISDLAQFVCDENPEAGIKVIYNIPKNIDSFGYNPEMKISLDTHKLEKLGWQAKEDLSIIFKDLIEGMRDESGKII